MEIKNKEELLLKLRMNVVELSNEYPTFEKQVVKKNTFYYYKNDRKR